jgi:hypothetical protein
MFQLLGGSRNVMVTSPNGGEEWLAQSTHTIEWSYGESTVDLYFSEDSGTSWTLIEAGVPNTHSYEWVTPDENIRTGRIRVVDVDTGNFDDSDADFAILSTIVISPNGGEEWLPQSTHTITWLNDSAFSVNLYFSTDSGNSWSTIEAGVPNTNSYEWIVPDVNITTGRIRVEDSGTGNYDDSNADFSILPIVVTSPNGGEEWVANSVQTIEWSYGESSVDLYFSTDSGNNWSLIEAGVLNTHSYEWIVPDMNITTGRIRIEDSGTGNYDDSNADFSIYLPGEVISPNGGEEWAAKSTHLIQWLYGASTVNLYFSEDSGSNWILIASGVPNSGAFEWVVPNVEITTARIIIEDPNTGIFDYSDADFAIYKPIVVISPNGGEEWPISNIRTILWENGRPSSKIDLYLSTDSGVSWSFIASGLDNTGSYDWLVPTNFSSTDRIRVNDPSTGDFDDSDSDFSIVSPYQVELEVQNPFVARGEKLVYDITFTNIGDSQITFKYWAKLQLPSGKFYPFYIVQPCPVTLKQGESQHFIATQTVPRSFAIGEYWYYGYVGTKAPAYWDVDSFNFVVMPFDKH